MEASIRPWYTTGIALVGATAIAMAPITPIASSSPAVDVRAASAAVSREFQLNAFELPYILTLPILRQQFVNWAQNWAVYLAGLGKSAVGIGQSVLAIPEVTVQIVQQVLALDFVGAFDTFTSAARNAVIAIGQPLLDSLIWRNQKLLAAQTALEAAVPKAFIDVINGFLVAGNGVVTSLIVGTQDFIGAVLTLNLGNIINAALDGTRNFITALGAGAGAIVAGIESAQFGIATALATPPPPSPFAADVSSMSTLSAERTIRLAPASSADAIGATHVADAPDDTAVVEAASVLDATPSASVTPPVEETTAVKAAGAEAEPQGLPKAPAATDTSGSVDVSHEAADPTGVPKKPVDATPAKDTSKVDDTVTKVTTKVDKDDDAKGSTGVKKDAGADPKPAAGTDDE
jgi:hypothetical protein